VYGRAGSNLRPAQGGLNQIDANTDIIPYDSVSNPNNTRRFDSVGRLGGIINKGGLRPDMDSFY
jgi:hypothetical protein